jgi:hypothetical protein
VHLQHEECNEASSLQSPRLFPSDPVMADYLGHPHHNNFLAVTDPFGHMAKNYYCVLFTRTILH